MNPFLFLALLSLFALEYERVGDRIEGYFWFAAFVLCVGASFTTNKEK